jgi:hypothetical protein
MSDAEHTREPADVAATDEVDLRPQEAAALLRQTNATAQRAFAIGRPLMSAIQALAALVAFGTVWLSVRAQHPYAGPTGGALAVLYGLVVVLIVVVSVNRRMNAGLGGRVRRQERAVSVTLLLAYVADVVLQGALYHAGVSHAVVYGIFPATAPFIIVGSAAGAYAVGREDWVGFATALCVVALAAGSAFAGPVEVWAVMGVGLCVIVLGYAVARARLTRR